jgi:predicted nucleic acid-binding protein
VAVLTVLDAYPIVAYLVGEPAADEVMEVLAQGGATTTSLNVAEAIDVACRVYGASETRMRGAVEMLVASELLAVTAPSIDAAFRAAELRIARYGRRRQPLSLADCFLVAAAGPDDRIATADPSVAEIARAEGIGVLALPDSAGRRP